MRFEEALAKIRSHPVFEAKLPTWHGEVLRWVDIAGEPSLVIFYSELLDDEPQGSWKYAELTNEEICSDSWQVWPDVERWPPS